MKLVIGIRFASVVSSAALGLIAIGCSSEPEPSESTKAPTPMIITNSKLTGYKFLKDMYKDGYFPDFLVDKCKQILVDLSVQIETKKPSTDAELFELTHAATERINDLAEEFEDNDSELETGAREALGEDFAFIVEAYGFEVDIEDVIAPRDW